MTGRRVWTPEEVRALGVRTTVPIAGEIIAGLSPTQSYEAVKKGTFPVPVIRVGRRMVVPVAPILALLGISPDSSEAAPGSAARSTTVPNSTNEDDDDDHGTLRRSHLRALG